MCASFLRRYAHVLDSDCTPVDAWQHMGKTLTQKEREKILTLDSATVRFANAVRET